MIAVRANITNLRNQLRQLSTGHQIARRQDNSGYSFVNKSLLNARSAHRGRPIRHVNLLDRVRTTRSTNLGNRPPATKSP
jgi:hypothetical protein